MTKLRGLIWPLLALLAAIIPVAGAFSPTRIFYVRDLTLAFRSRFLFLRRAVYSGVWPTWDPYPANGQSAVNDALNQLFHVPSLLVRLLLPDVPAYNLWIALPVPLAATGMYLFLRRHLTPAAAAVGSCAFAVAGPVVSTTNFPNMSWSVATVPFVFWTLERLLARGRATDAALMALTLATQALAGEPVTLAATVALVGAYAVFCGHAIPRSRAIVLVGAAAAAGILLAAVQLLPLFHAGRESIRSVVLADDSWSLHPVAMPELVVPHFFGDHFHSRLQELPWMVALNSRREPFYYSMYLGVPAVLAAAVAAFSGRPRTTFWAIAIVVCVMASFGAHTWFLPALQAILPPLRSFRYPVKYLSLAAFGVATLATCTVQWLIDGNVPRRALAFALGVALVVAAAVYGIVAWLLIEPHAPIRLFFRLAMYVQVPQPIQAAESVIFRARPLLTAFFLKLLCGSLLLWVAASAKRERRLALPLFAAYIAVDLVASNSGVNPTMPVAWLAPPEWTRHVPPGLHERVYVGGRLGGFVDTSDIDAPKYRTDLEGFDDLEMRFLVVNEMAYYPSGLGLREAMSYDLPALWPLDYARLLTRFRDVPREDRLRVLTRTAVRFCVLPDPPYPGAQPLAKLRGFEQSKLYDVNPGARRTYVVPDALRGPDERWAILGLFQPQFDPASGVLVSEAPPPPSGVAGPAVPASAAFVTDGITEVVVSAGLPADGYLALLDSYDPDWRVTVDGAPAPLMRANGLFRAVHLPAGRHVVRFTYHSRAMRQGGMISAASALALLGWCVLDRNRRRQEPA